MRVSDILPIFAITTFLVAIPWTNSCAHEGDEHGEQSKPMPVAGTAAPRAEAASENFELVAVTNSGAADDLSRSSAHQ